MRIHLLPLDATVQAALARDAEYRDALATGNWPQLAAAMQRIVGPETRDAADGGEALHWESYAVVDHDTRALVGSCGFKGAPIEDGIVEIAYFTYPGFEGRGYATAMATRLIALATGSPQVRQIIAHTLPESNASTRILTKVGMRHVGEVIDPDDGPVWRWELHPVA